MPCAGDGRSAALKLLSASPGAQTDADISVENSGGILVDSSGHVVGMTVIPLGRNIVRGGPRVLSAAHRSVGPNVRVYHCISISNVPLKLSTVHSCRRPKPLV